MTDDWNDGRVPYGVCGVCGSLQEPVTTDGNIKMTCPKDHGRQPYPPAATEVWDPWRPPSYPPAQGGDR